MHSSREHLLAKPFFCSWLSSFRIRVPGGVYYTIGTFLPLIRKCVTPHMYYSYSRLTARVQVDSVSLLSNQLLQSVLCIAVQQNQYGSNFPFKLGGLVYMPLPPPLLLVAYANTSRRFFSDKEAWSICHYPLPYC